MPSPRPAPPLVLFSPEQLAHLVSTVLPVDAQPNEKVVVGTIDQHGLQVVASFAHRPVLTAGFAWEFQAAARHDWDGTYNLGAKVLLRWP